VARSGKCSVAPAVSTGHVVGKRFPLRSRSSRSELSVACLASDVLHSSGAADAGFARVAIRPVVEFHQNHRVGILVFSQGWGGVPLLAAIWGGIPPVRVHKTAFAESGCSSRTGGLGLRMDSVGLYVIASCMTGASPPARCLMAPDGVGTRRDSLACDGIHHCLASAAGEP
jgi:hypothetical protein